MKNDMKDEQKMQRKLLSDLNKLKKQFFDYHKEYIQRDIRYKLLCLVEEYQDKIEDFRNRWRFPDEYFRTLKACRHWWKNLPAEVKNRRKDIFYYEEEQVDHIKNMDELFTASYPSKHEPLRKIPAGRSLKHLFIYEVEKLMVECHVDPFWYYPFEHFVLYNEINLNFMFNPGFAITLKTIKDEDQNILSQYVSISFSAKTRLKDIQQFAFPLIKYYQAKLLGFKEDKDKISKDDEQEYQLGPKNLPKQKDKTWLVSSGFVHSHPQRVLKKKRMKK